MNRLLEILCVSAAFVVNVLAEKDGPRSINLALETSLLFEPKDAYKHLKLIAEARRFLDKLEKAISPPKEALRSGGKDYLTNFLNELCALLMTLDDETLREFFISLEFEMRLHYYKGSIFREILHDKMLSYFRSKLKEWANSDPRMTRAKITKYILSEKHKNTPLNRLGKFLNDYYESEQNEKMIEIMEKLRSNEDVNKLGDIIRYGVNALVIQHYDRMNYTARAKITDEVNSLNKLNEFTKNDKSDAEDDLQQSFKRFLKDFSISDMEHVNDVINEIESENNLVYNKNAELFVKSIDADVVTHIDKDGDAKNIKEIDDNNISIDNVKFLRNHQK